MKSIEKVILTLAVVSIAIVSGSYAYNFFAFSLSPVQSDWAALGDYFGGILAPILSFFLVVLIINEAMESRKTFLESKELQLISQKQINEQIELLKPKPELVYYLSARGSMVYAILENIGNATAYNVELIFKHEGKIEHLAQETFERFKNYHYLPPKYKCSMFIGHVVISHKVVGVATHEVKIRYSALPNSADTSQIYEREYFVDTNMLDTIYSEPNLVDALKDIAGEIKRIQSKH